MPLIFDKASVYYFQRYGPLAQLAERLVDVEEVTGSSPVQSTTIKKPPFKRWFLFYDIEAAAYSSVSASTAARSMCKPAL